MGRTRVVVGAGPIGSALAMLLARQGHRVRVVTRSGSGPGQPGIDLVAANASDPQALCRVADGAEVLYNCANPGSYQTWQTDWPPLAAALLVAAERTGAVLVTMSNLYGHGPVDGPMTSETPMRPTDRKGILRARMWQDALSAHMAGRVRITEARASDYIGPTVSPRGSLLARYARATLADRTAWVMADPDQPHSWAAIDDVAATLAVLGSDERAWGRAWIVPSAPASSVREVLRGLAGHVGAGEPKLRTTPRWALRAMGTVIPLVHEVVGILYQFDRPFIADGSETVETFGLAPTPWEPLLGATAHAWAARLGS